MKKWYDLKLEFVPCHRRADRSFFISGKQFPICARCMGIFIGQLSLPIIALKYIEIGFIASYLMIVPMLIDSFTQAYEWRESNNWLRLITGILAGVGMMSASTIIGEILAKWIFQID